MEENQQVKLAKLVNHVFNTDTGKQLLEQLKRQYIYASVIAESPEKTYYLVGQRDLIIGLEELSKLDSLDHLTENMEYQGGLDE